MEMMNESVGYSETTSVAMLKKYEETERNVVNIEEVVGKLVEELGDGGYMTLRDIRPGMKASMLFMENNKEFKAEIVEVLDGSVIVRSREREDITYEVSEQKIEFRIYVDNIVYMWKNIEPTHVKANGVVQYRLRLKEDPKVLNRRQYVRLPIENSCDVFVKSKSATYAGRMVNISAGGYAVEVTENEFVNCVGEQIQITIHDFALLEGMPLYGTILRCTDNHGSYTIGCRMLEDNVTIKNYVDEKCIVMKNKF